MAASEIPGLLEFLRDYPLMAIRPSAGWHLRLRGKFVFVAAHAEGGEVQESFALQIHVPRAFPKDLPEVTESDRRIPRTGDFHVNSDGTLCLGSPLGLLLKVSKSPTLTGFAESCLVPYLYAISHKLKFGGALLFGELAHGPKGMLADYASLLGLKHPQQAQHALQLLGLKRRRANKLPCPCGCGIRVGRCKFNFHLREFRALACRSWFRSQLHRYAAWSLETSQNR
jgi:hypothetical protein